MARPRLRLRMPRFRKHDLTQPCFVIDHLNLDGRVMCPEGRKLHAPGFWSRLFSKCRNLRDHGNGYVLHLECMWCRWAMDAWEKQHPNVAEQYPEPGFASIRPDLNLYSPTEADLFRDGRQQAFLAETQADLSAAS